MFFYFFSFFVLVTVNIFGFFFLIFFSYIGNHTHDFPAFLGLVAKKKSVNGNALKERIIFLSLLSPLLLFCDALFFGQSVHCQLSQRKNKTRKRGLAIREPKWIILFHFFTDVDDYFLACRLTVVITLH